MEVDETGLLWQAAASTRCPGPCLSRCASTAATAAPKSKLPTAAQKPGGFGILRIDTPWIHREGGLWHEPSHTDLLFVNLNKREALFSPSTRYRDLAFGASLFPRSLRALARIHTIPCHVT